MVVRVGYRQQTVCQSSQACELQRSQRYDRRISYYTAKPTTKSDDSEFMDCQTHIHSQLPVHLLRVCRQIYHEAVLKPFSQPTFDLGEGIVLHWGVGSFMARLVPVQARAIAQIRLTGISRLYRRPKIPNSQLRGLKYVEVQFFMRTDDFCNDIPLNELSSFRLEGTVERLRKLGLKSMRFTMLIKGDAPTDRDKALILEWMENAEDEILSKRQSLLTAG